MDLGQAEGAGFVQKSCSGEKKLRGDLVAAFST